MPNAVGGISIANNLLANSALQNLNINQSSLAQSVKRLSSGLRVNTAADDPSGLGISVNLQTQVDGFDTAVRNVQDASNAANVADGALQGVTNILQRIRSLAIEASSDITSISDKQALQAEVSQLLLEVNRISNNTNFNGANLLDGSHAGPQPQFNATALITANTTTGAGSNLISSVQVSATSNTIFDGTIELQVAQISATQQGIIFSLFTSSTGTGSQLGVVTVTAGTFAVTNIDGVTITYAGAATIDVGITSFIKVGQYTTFASNPSAPAFNFQSGAAEGATIQVGLLSTSTASLRISQVNVATTATTGFAYLGAEDAIGQIDQALQTVNQQRATLGAVIVRLQEDAKNDNTASVNLQASESAIRDLNVGQETANYNKNQILVQVGTTVLAQSNTNAQTVLGLFR